MRMIKDLLSLPRRLSYLEVQGVEGIVRVQDRCLG